MGNVFKVLKNLIGILLCFQIGCAIKPIQILQEKTCENIAINSYNSQSSIYSEKNQPDIIQKPDFLNKKNGLIISSNQPCRIKYHDLYSRNRNIIVEGQIGNKGKKYPVVLDTGASQAIFLNAALVRKNKLPVYSLENSDIDFNEHKLGTCLLHELKTGNVTFVEWPCIYLETYTPLSLFGIPIASSTFNNDNIILGMPLLREFKYIAFDNINQEAVLSYHKSFEPRDENLWEKYPTFMEEDFHGNTFLFVNVTFSGVETELQLDTGSGRGLAIGETLWKQIKHRLSKIKLKKRKEFYPYIGNLPCRNGKIPEFSFCNRTIKNADISVFPDDSPLLGDCEGLVGMQFFSNQVIVLDFEHDIMWLRK